LRILHVIGSLIHGGAEALLYRIATRPSDAEHIIVSFAPPAHYSRLLSSAGVEVHHLGTVSPISGVLATGRLLRLMRELKPDVVQGWMYRSNVLAGLCAKLLGVPMIWGIHCSSFQGLKKRSRGWIYLSGLLAKWLPNRVINCSMRSLKRHERIGYDPAIVEVVFNGYDTSVFRPDEHSRASTRAALGIADDCFLVGNISRWHPQKDHGTLIAALEQLKNRLASGWHCILVGRDLDQDNVSLAKLISAAQLNDQITCLGPRSDITGMMRALDLHILSSSFGEAFPNVVAEAMASGTPCVVTDVGDSEFIIGETGWCAPPREPEQLAEAIRAAHLEWSLQPDRWQVRTRNARHRIVENFTLAKMIDGYEQIWMQVAAPATVGRSGAPVPVETLEAKLPSE
jgi:glycosyltransferase involved in cell wall biosynthesis